MQKLGQPCILENRSCSQCGECDYCEITPNKICNNCCKCFESEADYLEIQIEDILINTEDIK